MFDETTTKLEVPTPKSSTDSNIIKVDFTQKTKETPPRKTKSEKRTRSNLLPSLSELSPLLVHALIFGLIVGLSLFLL